MKKHLIIFIVGASTAAIYSACASSSSTTPHNTLRTATADTLNGKQSPNSSEEKITGDLYIGQWDCTLNFHGREPWMIFVRPGNGNYVVTFDRKNDNESGIPKTFPAKFQDGALVPIANEYEGSIFFEPGNVNIIHFGKWTFDRNPE